MLTPARTEDMRFQNRARVLSAVRSFGHASRAAIGEHTGLSAATVSTITADFINESVLTHLPQDDSASSKRGRPKVELTLNPQAAMVCSVYLQIDSVRARLVDFAGSSICDHKVPLPLLDISATDIKNALIKAVDLVLADQQHERPIDRIMVGFQGVTDVDGKVLLWTPICNAKNMPIADWLNERFHVPVSVANDCDMIVQGLHWREPERYGNNFAAVLLAHGVGMGLHLRNTLINGTASSGVEFGHMSYRPDGALCRCGNFGCIEAYAGDYALSRRVNGQDDHTKPASMMEAPDFKTIGELAQQGDPTALEALKEAGAALGTGLANIFAIVDAFPIVFVGRGTVYFPYMEEAVRTALQKAPGIESNTPLNITCVAKEEPLVHDGCAITALLEQDNHMAKRRLEGDSVNIQSLRLEAEIERNRVTS